MSTHKQAIFPLALATSLGALPYLPLGMIVAHLRSHNDGALAREYNINRILVAGCDDRSVEQVYEAIAEAAPAICLFSVYSWNHNFNLEVAAKIRQIAPASLIIFGGPDVPKFEGDTETYLHNHPFIDVAVREEGEAACTEILEAMAGQSTRNTTSLAAVTGLVYREGTDLTRTPDRKRIADINALPSPYLTGEFEPWFMDMPIPVLETNRGCPYGCTYCDWGSATLAKVTRFTPERVKAEISYLAEKRSSSIFIADANFGMLEQDIEIAQFLVETREKSGYPKSVFTNFAKNGGRRLMAVIEILHEGGLLPTGIIALQTTDPAVLKTIKRDNIKTSAYEKMMGYFNEKNIPMSSDLMVGLPGQTVDSLQGDLQFCFNWKVSAHVYYTSMMPNAPMAAADYRKEHMIASDEDGLVASTATFTERDMTYMKQMYLIYHFHIRLGVIKYLLYYFQLEHGVNAIELLRLWQDRVLADDDSLPLSVRLFNEVLIQKRHMGQFANLRWNHQLNFLFRDIESYYREIIALVENEYSVVINESEIKTLIRAQQAVMPKLGRRYPYRVTLNHDVTTYFEQIKLSPSVLSLKGKMQTLGSFPASALTSEAEQPQLDTLAFAGSVAHIDGWELPSALRPY